MNAIIKNIVDSDTLWKIWITLASYPHFPHHLDNYKEVYSSACSYPHYQQYDDEY